ALACIPLLKFQAPWWAIQKHEEQAAILLLGTYAASALAVMLFVRTEGQRAAAIALLITLGIFGVALPAIVTLLDHVPRYLLLPVCGAAVVLIPLSVVGTPMLRAGVVALTLVAISAGALSYREIAHPRQAAYRKTESVVATAFYALRVVNRDGAIPMPAT